MAGKIKNIFKQGADKKTRVRGGMGMYILTMIFLILVIALVMTFSCGMSGVVLGALLDMPSLMLIILIAVPILLGSGLWKDMNHAFRMIVTKKWDVTLGELKRADYAIKVMMISILAAGIFGTVCSFIMVMVNVAHNGAMEMEILCANLHVAVLPFFYAMLVLIFLIPAKAITKRHVLDYMEKDI